MTMRMWLVMTIALLSVVQLTSAATYYVAVTGDDGATGTEAAPFQTLMKAATVAKPGDTVLVKAGVYPGGMGIGCNGAEGQPITFKPAGDGPVRFLGRMEPVTGFALAEGKQKTYVADVTGDVAGVAVDRDTTRLVVEGLTRVQSAEEVEAQAQRWFHDKEAGKLYVNYLNAPFAAEHTIHVLRDGSGLNVGGSWLVVEGFTISGFSNAGVAVGGGQHIVLRNLRVSLCGFPWGGCVSFYQTNGVTIEDCVLFRAGNGVMAQQVKDTKLLHSTIYRTRAHGVIMYEAEGTVLRNNIICAGGPSGSALYVGKNSEPGLRSDYNCLLDSGTAVLVNWTPLNGLYATFWDYRAAIKDQDQHSLSDDPLFVSTQQEAEDFTLQPDSPCKGKADDGGDLGARGSARKAE